MLANADQASRRAADLRRASAREQDAELKPRARPDVAEARAAWQQTAPTWDHARLVFLDDSGVRTDLIRRYGCGQRGARVVDHAPDSRWHTPPFLAALRVTGLTAPAVFDGPIDGVSVLA